MIGRGVNRFFPNQIPWQFLQAMCVYVIIQNAALDWKPCSPIFTDNIILRCETFAKMLKISKKEKPTNFSLWHLLIVLLVSYFPPVVTGYIFAGYIIFRYKTFSKTLTFQKMPSFEWNWRERQQRLDKEGKLLGLEKKKSTNGWLWHCL